MAPREHQTLLTQALEREGEAQRALLAGDKAAAAALFGEVADLYRRSWEVAPSGAYGRLVGMLKAAILSGTGVPEAGYVKDALSGEGWDSPTGAYALGLAALVEGDDAVAERAAGVMSNAGDAFGRTADAIAALARADADVYRDAIKSIVTDFESRTEHLTGVAIADTAAVLEKLAASRGIAPRFGSRLLPQA